MISAVGVDGDGHKHVLGIQPGATENAAAVEDLLQQLVARGVNPKAKRLFVIDGAKDLRAAIAKVFGPHPKKIPIAGFADLVAEEGRGFAD